jgi:hypothetical protein
LFAKDVRAFDLGSGDPSLHIIFHSANEYVVYADKHYMAYLPKTPGYDVPPGDWRKGIEIFVDRNFRLREKLGTDFWREGEQQLYAFGEQTAFACNGTALASTPRRRFVHRSTQIFSIQNGKMVVSEDVDSLARARYGLTTNQIFLGRVATNIYFWIPPDGRRVYFRDEGARTSGDYFLLPKGVEDVFGATRAASTNRAVAFWGLKKQRALQSPVDYFFIEASVEDAKRVIVNQ